MKDDPYPEDAAREQVVRSLCEQEQIHIPRAIQPFGALMATLANGTLITHASANLGSILGHEARAVLGRPLHELVGDAVSGVLLGAGLRHAKSLGQAQEIPGPGGGMLHLQSFSSGRHVCIDIEPEQRAAWQKPNSALVRSVVESFADATTPVELCGLAVRGLQLITGYDRVMAYRFTKNGDGEVVAEACLPTLTPFLGQHYPASDIPPQARHLYLNQRVGSIADCRYVPVPILADLALDDGSPLDLTYSSLRSASPVHRAYMQNMQTSSSLTIGLGIKRGASGRCQGGRLLWGMLVCHHGSPRVAGPQLRATADMVGQIVSVLLPSLEAAGVQAQLRERTITLRTLAARLASPAPPAESLAAIGDELLRLVDAAGALVRFSGTLYCIGAAPEQKLADLAMALLYPGVGGEAQAVDDLGLRYPELAGCIEKGSGALLMPLGTIDGDAILWFRPEHAHEIVWGGNPDEHGMADRLTGLLSPRSSFAAWKEIVRGRSAPWTERDISLAGDLRQLVDVELGRRAEAAQYLFNQVFESSPAALVLTGPAGEIRMLNPRAGDLLQYGRCEIAGKPFAELLPQRVRNLVFGEPGSVSIIEALRAAAGQPDLSGLRRDGSEFPMELEFRPVTAAEYPFGPAVQINFVDITLRRQIDREKRRHEQDLLDKQCELERSNSDLEEFCYAVSHDLKAPLRAIGHLAQWIGEDIGIAAPPETQANINLLQSRVVRMQKLLEGLLAYSSLAKTDKSIEVLDIGDVMDNVVFMLAPPPGFTIRCVGPMPLIRTERAAIQMVLENLIGNALKHHDRPVGLIEISMNPVDGLLEFRVRDDGPGIAPQFHQRIFTIFQTLKTRDEFEANGIGLAIVKRKIEGHGGLIWVESAPPIRGTTFVFTWKESTP